MTKTILCVDRFGSTLRRSGDCRPRCHRPPAFLPNTCRVPLIRTLPICASLSRSDRLCSRQPGHTPIRTTFTKPTA